MKTVVLALLALSVCAQTVTNPSGGAGGGSTIPATGNMIKGNGAGNGADSGIAPTAIPTSFSSSDSTLACSIAANVLACAAGVAMATLAANNQFTGDNLASELCAANGSSVTTNRWVQKTATGCQTMTAASTSQPAFGIAQATVTGASASIVTGGRFACAYSGTAVLGNWATADSVGRCVDSGVAGTATAPAGAVAIAEAAGTGNVLVSLRQLPAAAAATATIPATLTPWPAFSDPAYTATGTASSLVAPSGVSHSGMAWAFIAKATNISRVDYQIVTVGAAGTGIIFGIYSADLTTQLCQVIAIGTDVTTTGSKSVAISSCPTLTIGKGYKLAISSDSAAVALLAFGDAVGGWAMFNLHASPANSNSGYCAANDCSTGTGGSLVLAALSGLTWTAFLENATRRPVIYFEY